ncbi:FtsP/CotA-like multicopper oxidase with cupredoxin domain [Rhodoligotrophos appendicifer]|uniref:multicopper oxidase domain-containing protein n=1 Tax=Rhodoligotrophos appendicifer TaxID=987056 RepID=UPI001FE6D713|nr:multicopper oxidase domain-containing protein [Rhodoligotrophos appendicifer]
MLGCLDAAGRSGSHRGRNSLVAALLGIVVVLVLSSPASQAQGAGSPTGTMRSEFREPVTLISRDGVLEVRLTARQGEAALDTVAGPVKNFLLFSYELIRGTASNGQTSGENLYPAPTLQVFPGEKLIVHLENGLSDLAIRDFYSPQYTATGQDVPLYPIQLTSAPLNLHVHGLHVSPKGNSDNVMIHMPAGTANTYTYDVPKSMPQGVYWYHSHLHGLTAAQVYLGLVGMLAIGRTDGGLPIVTENKIPIRNMLLQYNYVFDREGGQEDLNNPYWPQYVSTLVPPEKDELASGTYRPLMTPINFDNAKPGAKFITNWYAGPLSIRNFRGRMQFIPSNLVRFTSFSDDRSEDVPDRPSLPDEQRDVQFTVNGQFQPAIKSKAGQTEIWVLANVSDIAYMNVQLTETATGNHPKIAIVGQDGNPYGAVHTPPTDNGTRLVIPPASRFAIAVTIPAEGDLVLEIPSRGDGAKTIALPGIAYTNNGTENPPAVLGSVSTLPDVISYDDGFFLFPTQVLARATSTGEKGVTTPFVEGQPLNAYTSFVELSGAAPDVKREIKIGGGFLNNMASQADPKSFVYAFDGGAFPNVPLVQPRLNSVEEWTFVNFNNDEHPIHVHVNDFQVTEYFDPTTGLRTGPDKFGVDNANVPAPTMHSDEFVVQPGRLSMRTRFDDYDGLYVMHCHRLNHEDNGLMALINVIPEISAYAVAVPGAAGKPAEVRVYDGNGDRLLATIVPFPGFEGSVSVAMGDADDDSVLDLVVGTGAGRTSEVVAFSGKSAFTDEILRFQPFAADARGGISVAVSSIDGGTGDNIIVGSGPGMASEVRVYGGKQASGAAPDLFSSFAPYEGDTSGVTLATGFVDFSTGRNSIVTAPGAGTETEVKVFAFPLLTPLAKSGHGMAHGGRVNEPIETSSFKPYGQEYKDGVSLATGWLAGVFGGAKRIIVGQLGGRGTVKIFSSGSALDGGPSMYLHNPNEHGHGAGFREIASFEPFGGAPGSHVAATSTVYGANLLVSGGAASGAGTIVKYDFARPAPEATTLEPVRIGEVAATKLTQPAVLAGN